MTPLDRVAASAGHVVQRSVRRAAGATLAAVLALACGSAGSTAAPRDETRDATPAERVDAEAAPSPDASQAAQKGAAKGPAFDGARAWRDLERQVAFGPRPSGSAALTETRNFIVGELKAAGIAVRLQPFTARTPVGEIAMVNVVGTIPGRRPERIAFASHYDTKLFKDIRFVGASDGASSTAALLELGRALAGRQHEFTIELLFFDGEEAVIEWSRDNDNTYGSRHYVSAAQQDGSLRTMQALILLDMIGDKDLVIRRDANSTPWLVDVIWATAARLGHRRHFSNELVAIDDDHIPFQRAGVPVVDVIDLDYPAWHTADDTLDNVAVRSLQIVGDVVLAALPEIEQRLSTAKR